MANIRIIYNDLAAGASISASNNASQSYTGDSLKTNSKSLAHRSANTNVTYTLTWAADQTINGVILPATNLSSASTVLVAAKNSSGTTVYTSGTISACTNTTLDGFTGVKDVNSFPYGGLSKTAVWFSSTPTTVRSLEITLTRGTNPSASPAYPSYIDCSRIICGKYWEPQFGVDKGNLNLTIADTTTTTRTDGGDLVADRGTIHDELRFNFGLLTKSDKEELVKILKSVGTYKNIAISLFPDNNSRDEQDYIIYGKRETSSIDYLVHNFYSHSFSVIGW